MPIFDTLRSVFGTEERTFSYQCRDCERVFESTTPSSSQASCPDCEDSFVQSAPQKTLRG